MPQPTQTEAHVDAILTNISVAYRQKASDFIAPTVFPVVPVPKQSDLYFTYNKEDWFRDEAAERSDDAESVGSGYHLGTDSYLAKVWAFHKDVGPQARANFDSPLDADRDATEFVTQRLMLRQEIDWVDHFFATAIWSNTVIPAAADKWSNYATSDPKSQIEDGKEAILSTTGFEPNTLVVGYQVDRQLRNHPDIKEQNKYTSSQSITSEMVARYLGVDRYLVARAIKNTSREGNATQTLGFVHGKHALLCYAAPSPSLLMPTAGYTFMWSGISGGIGTNIAINRIPMPWKGIGTERIEGQIAYVYKKVADDMGYFFESVVA